MISETKIQALITLLDDEDPEVVEHVEREIVGLGVDIIPFLEKEWEKNFNPLVQKRIEDLVHQLQYDIVYDRLLKWKEKGGEDLLEGMWILATYQYPDIELEKIRGIMEQIYFEVWSKMKEDLLPLEQTKLLNQIIFNDLKFSANTKNFHSPSNSMINVVLDSRKGNPISLCVVYMLIAQKLKIPVYGVNLPNLFILTYKTDQTQFYINVFNKGLVFTRADVDNYIAHLNLSPNPVFYEPCSHLDIILRVLRNLISSFEKLGEMNKVEEIRKLYNAISDSEL